MEEKLRKRIIIMAVYDGAEFTEPYRAPDVSLEPPCDPGLFYYKNSTAPTGVYRHKSMSEMKYHTSFDWLVPVMHKLNVEFEHRRSLKQFKVVDQQVKLREAFAQVCNNNVLNAFEMTSEAIEEYQEAFKL